MRAMQARKGFKKRRVEYGLCWTFRFATSSNCCFLKSIIPREQFSKTIWKGIWIQILAIQSHCAPSKTCSMVSSLKGQCERFLLPFLSNRATWSPCTHAKRLSRIFSFRQRYSHRMLVLVVVNYRDKSTQNIINILGVNDCGDT